jgi:hypothetical protein
MKISCKILILNWIARSFFIIAMLIMACILLNDNASFQIQGLPEIILGGVASVIVAAGLVIGSTGGYLESKQTEERLTKLEHEVYSQNEKKDNTLYIDNNDKYSPDK